MARPTGVRTLAGYTLGERIAQDIYGEVFRATEGKGGKKELTLLVVEPRLAADDQFAEALSRGTAPLLDAFHHRSVVGTVVVAQDGKSLVVVTEGTGGAISLAEILERTRARGGKVQERIAATIARAVVDGLATAHAAGIVHGALHPRSVLVDRDGSVRVTDFAVGNAAMTAAAAGSDAVSLKGLAGYLAPELALGDDPSPPSDVYGVGALLFAMLTGETPPGSLNTSAAVERLVQRALDTDLARRFGNAIELQENLAEALEDDRWESAGTAELARFVNEVAGAAPESNLDAATEDLLASLSGGAVEVTRPSGVGMSSVAGSEVGSSIPGLGDSGISGMAQAHARRPGSRPGARNQLDSLIADLEDSTADGPLTMVDEPKGQVGRDPISELIALEAVDHAESAPTAVHDPDGTPLPPPQPDEPGTLTREAVADPSRSAVRRVEAAPLPSRLVEKTRPKHKPEATPPPVFDAPPTGTPAPKPAVAEAPRMRFVKPADDVADDVPVPSLKRSPIWTWLGLIVLLAGGAALFFYLRKQGKELTGGEKAAAELRAQKEKERDELERRLRAEQADPGSIRVTSTPDGAAVWLLLGRTPFDSIPLKTQAVWEMRVELEGYKTQDVRVGGAGWTGKPEDLRASIDVKLDAGTNMPALPAMPPEPPASDRAGLVDGSGSLHATSKPEGAAVWLLVGITNTMELQGIEAGQPYELRVQKDGFVPGYVRVTGEEWRQGGDPALPLSAAPKRDVIEKSVSLVPAPPAKKNP
ncbi:MAG TPA: protein kinase [Kofleriaceae bacterium]|nr:protein kinase [Kofleriaceae bacterium]